MGQDYFIMNVLRISVVLLSVLSSGSIIFLLYGVYLTPLIFIFTVLLFIFSRKLSIKKTYLLSSFFVVLIMFLLINVGLVSSYYDLPIHDDTVYSLGKYLD